MAESRSLGEFVVSDSEGSVVAEAAVEGPHQMLTAADARVSALAYLYQGWAVTAGPGLDESGVCACRGGSTCRNPGKHAYPGWGESGKVKRKTMSAESVEKYWADDNKLWLSRPVEQLFIVPYLSGLVVADVDNMDAWKKVVEEEGVPDTLWVRSGSGHGGHFLFKYDWGMGTEHEVLPSLPGKLPYGAGEIKFRGIIAAAPSVHKSGGRYSWANWGHEIADAPEWMVTKREHQGRDMSLGNLAPTFAQADMWQQLMFKQDWNGLDSLRRVSTGRPVALFAIVAKLAKWIDAGWVAEQQVIDLALQGCIENGAMETYEEEELLRQINNALLAGRENY